MSALLVAEPAFARQVFEDVSNTAVGSGQPCSAPGSRTLDVPVNIIIDDIDFEFLGSGLIEATR